MPKHSQMFLVHQSKRPQAYHGSKGKAFMERIIMCFFFCFFVFFFFVCLIISVFFNVSYSFKDSPKIKLVLARKYDEKKGAGWKVRAQKESHIAEGFSLSATVLVWHFLLLNHMWLTCIWRQKLYYILRDNVTVVWRTKICVRFTCYL